MDNEKLISQAGRIILFADSDPDRAKAEGLELLRLYSSPESSFFTELQEVSHAPNRAYMAMRIKGILNGFIAFVENGLVSGVSMQRRAQIDVVSDFLEQAQGLLSSRGVHPAIAAALIGASLEEFLRTWIEEQRVALPEGKPGIDLYARTLRASDTITKQDLKDITSWAGLRNHAAHGEWSEVEDPEKISMMLQGVNLFMRKYSN